MPINIQAENGGPVELKRTYCKVCITNCGLVAEVENDSKILKIKGDRDHPIIKGYSCPKGRAMGENYHLDQPVTHPMMRGVCSIPHGHKDANINNLTCTDDMDPIGGMGYYSAVPIEIAPVASSETDMAGDREVADHA